jgi:hypothetical protein
MTEDYQEDDLPKDASTANKIIGAVFIISAMAVSIYLITALITWVKSW